MQMRIGRPGHQSDAEEKIEQPNKLAE